MIQTGVVIVNYHTDKQAIDTANKYAEFNCISHVVIINNDASKALDKSGLKNNKKVTVKNTKKNLGYSRGNNAGIRFLENIGCELFIISNSDIEITEDTAEKLIEKMNQNPEYGILAPRMYTYTGEPAELRYIPLGYKRAFLRIFKGVDSKSEKKVSCNDGIYNQSFVPGSLFITSRKAISECDYFDKNVFMYREEEILAQRMSQAGYKVGIVKGLKYTHLHRYDLMNTKDYLKMYRQEFASERYFFKKYKNAGAMQIAVLTGIQGIYAISRSAKYGRAKKNIRFSVIVPSYNADDKIRLTIESVICQKYKNYELIIQDGGSTDNTIDIIKEYSDGKTVIYESSQDNGIYDAMNRALKKVSGEYVIFLGCGDYLASSDVLSNIVDNVKDLPDIIYGNVNTTVNGEENVMNRRLNWWYTFRFEPVCHQAVFAKRKLFEEKDFNTEYEAVADQDWLMYMLKNGKTIKYINMPVAFYEESGYSADDANVVNKAEEDLINIHKTYYPGRKDLADFYRKVKKVWSR